MPDLRIPLALDSLKNEENRENVFPFTLTEKEEKSLPFLKEIEGFEVKVSVKAASAVSVINLAVSGDVILKDALDASDIPYGFDNDADIVIDVADESNSDILPDPDGVYDLRPSILALIYSAIPSNYSHKELKSTTVNGVRVMSMEEYENGKKSKEEKRKSSPFAALDENDFPDR